MIDAYKRTIDYLRISVTDRCNLRCRYCMPENGVEKLSHDEILSFEEIVAVTKAAVKQGVRKVRITGGEPLVRSGIEVLCRDIKNIDGVEELGITTNGLLLQKMAPKLKEAGVDRVNISLDSLDPEKYRHLTRGGDLSLALQGIQAAKEWGLEPIKINVVLIKGFNDDEIPRFVELTRDNDYEVRFIELMPIGEGIAYWNECFVPNSAVLQAVPELKPIEGRKKCIAEYYALEGAKGRVGLINPVSSHFCSSCNRLRLTADGMLKPCLHSDVEIPVKGLNQQELEEAIVKAVMKKPQSRGDELSAVKPSAALRRMNQIGG